MAPGRGADDIGQSTVEWLGLVLIVSVATVAVLGMLARGISVVGLAQAIATRLICATDLSDACSASGPLVAAYGPELAAKVEANAPEIDYEKGMTELPADFRACRDVPCSEGPETGAVRASATGDPAVAFVHVVDCRDTTPPGSTAANRYDCSGERAGMVYVQYWLYYADSSTTPWSDLPGSPGSHDDDWEGYQVRIGAAGTDARATSHHGTTIAAGRSIGPRMSASSRRPPGARPRGTSTSRTQATPGTSTSRPGSRPCGVCGRQREPRSALPPRLQNPIPASGTNGRSASL